MILSKELVAFSESLDQLKMEQKVVLELQWSLPVLPMKAIVSIAELKELNVVEEFILKLCSDNQSMPLGMVEIGKYLGMSEVFIKPFISRFLDIHLLNATGNGFKITEEGVNCLEKGTAPAPIRKETISFYWDPIFNKLRNLNIDLKTEGYRLPILGKIKDIFIPLKLNEDQLTLILEKNNIFIGSDLQILNHEILTSSKLFDNNSFCNHVSLSPETPEIEINKKITALNNLAVEWVNYGEVWVYDFLEKEFYCHVKNFYTGNIELEISRKLKKNADYQFDDFKKSLNKNISDIKPENIITKTSKTSVICLKNIRSTFIETLKSAKRQVIIISPWIKKDATNDEIIRILTKKASENVNIYIGYGISNNQFEDELPDGLSDKLFSLKNKFGMPCVYLTWVGNTHSKDVVVDQATVLTGSFNWLSYRGDYKPRVETALKSTEGNIIDEIYGRNIEVFISDLKAKLKSDKVSKNRLFYCHMLLGLNSENETISFIKKSIPDQPFNILKLLLSHKISYNHLVEYEKNLINNLSSNINQQKTLLFEISKIYIEEWARIKIQNFEVLTKYKFLDNVGNIIKNGILPIKFEII